VPKLVGIVVSRKGYRAFVRVKGFPLHSKRFPANTELQVMKDWRELTRAKLLVRRDQKIAALPASGSFRADVVRYLPAVAAMPTYAERVREMNVWKAVFGDQPSLEIASVQVQTMRDQWLTVGPRWVQRKGKGRILVDKPLSASAVNHRLRALSNFFTVLYPKADNPVKTVDEPDEGQGVPRSVPYKVVRQVITAMTDQGRAPKKGMLREDFSAAKVRARCLAWSGITPKELARLTKSDNRWKENLIVVTPRKKGRGAPGRLVPLTKEGRAAFREFDRRNLYGPFNVGVVNRALALACKAAGLPKITCYTFRHSFITGVVRATRNLKLGGLLAGHKDERTTRRYWLAAELAVMQDGMARFGRQSR
jgi:integrase